MIASWMVLMVILLILSISVIGKIRAMEEKRYVNEIRMAVIILLVLYVSSLLSFLNMALVPVLIIGAVAAGVVSLVIRVEASLQWGAMVHGVMAAIMGWMVIPMLGANQQVQYMEVLSLLLFILMSGWLFLTLGKESKSYNKLFLFCFVVLVFHEFLTYVAWPI
ncbi:hypothetical protein GCM10007216_07520 [Thalassobacillus devorans]|uniref:Uncharacterized protein n=1 Tax=Thalassobacillus devorans TaxID=279813 RepID=A0ABQ1NLK9_9BACI|nr:hypothetical protein [Thalassobacillus devorans]NIK27663.1 lysylphosphatidylglycerol synthetase-like protein (DUF2156 family) [Thalassobacillus devorans]GGC79552.1 hypothetical protein GCM10007216_07520 [Thalassobacillus devorans]